MHKKIINVQTGEIKEVALTQVEIDDVNARKEQNRILNEQIEAEKTTKETKKTSAKQKLIDLGLTEEEVKALIGV
jgi:curli biogenesis system outer membrane secretion channel CsgG